MRLSTRPIERRNEPLRSGQSESFEQKLSKKVAHFVSAVGIAVCLAIAIAILTVLLLFLQLVHANHRVTLLSILSATGHRGSARRTCTLIAMQQRR